MTNYPHACFLWFQFHHYIFVWFGQDEVLVDEENLNTAKLALDRLNTRKTEKGRALTTALGRKSAIEVELLETEVCTTPLPISSHPVSFFPSLLFLSLTFLLFFSPSSPHAYTLTHLLSFFSRLLIQNPIDLPFSLFTLDILLNVIFIRQQPRLKP